MGRKIALVGLNEQIFLLLVRKEYTIQEEIIKKCLLNLWCTWHKYISLTETIYLIQLYLINIASELKGPRMIVVI